MENKRDMGRESEYFECFVEEYYLECFAEEDYFDNFAGKKKYSDNFAEEEIEKVPGLWQD